MSEALRQAYYQRGVCPSGSSVSGSDLQVVGVGPSAPAMGYGEVASVRPGYRVSYPNRRGFLSMGLAMVVTTPFLDDAGAASMPLDALPHTQPPSTLGDESQVIADSTAEEDDDEFPARDGNTVVKIPVKVLFTRSYNIRPEGGLPKRKLRFVEHGG